MLCMTRVASKEYLVWLVLWDANHALHKYNLRLPKRWFYYVIMSYMLNMLVTYAFYTKVHDDSQLGKCMFFN